MSNEVKNSIRRIILDEAAQLNPVEALAIYCKFPHLEYITLLGDSYQLGPHSRLDQKSEAYKFLSEGELTRMWKLQSSAKIRLKRIYRCHPRITQQLLLPIYGEDMEIGVTAEERNMGEKHNVRRAKDGSPLLLVHVDGDESHGENRDEMRAVFFVLEDLIVSLTITRNSVI